MIILRIRVSWNMFAPENELLKNYALYVNLKLKDFSSVSWGSLSYLKDFIHTFDHN